MIPLGVLFFTSLHRSAFAAGAASVSIIEPKWERTPPTSKPHHGSTPLVPINQYVVIETDRDPLRHFLALPGSPYIGYTGQPFGGAPAGFGTTGMGPLGFALMVLTTPGVQAFLGSLPGQSEWETGLYGGITA